MIKTAIGFVKRILSPKKSEYTLKFNKEENNRWYIDLPEWGGSHSNLEMVAGADDLLDFLGGNPVIISCITSKENEDIEGYIKLERTDWGLTSGAYYSVNYDGINRKLWLCPVTLYVMGEYPEYLYVKKVD